jgi:hypothetical protein
MRSVTILTLFLLLCGCNGVKQPTDYSKLGLVMVQGTVTLEGQPVTSGSVTFEAEDRTFSAANLDANGHYELRFNSEQMGVTPGAKTVRISSRAVPTEGGDGDDPDQKPKAAAASEVPSCYSGKSPIHVTVEASRTRYDFDLKKDCSTTGAQ